VCLMKKRQYRGSLLLGAACLLIAPTILAQGGPVSSEARKQIDLVTKLGCRV
jgi:hypothetical protein